MRFVLDKDPSLQTPESANTCFLIYNSWDDFGFKTTFYAVFIDKFGRGHKLGLVRIMKRGQKDGKTPLQSPFFGLDDSFCSLGGDRSYYQNLLELNSIDRDTLLKGLRDCVADNQRYVSFRDEPAMRKSLLRDASEFDILTQFPRILTGDIEMTPVKFTYVLDDGPDNIDLTFETNPQSKPPTNIHVLIGRNGVGKTRLLAGMADALTESSTASIGLAGRFIFDATSGSNSDFLNLVIVSYSAFDRFDPIETGRARTRDSVPYYYVGIKTRVEGPNGRPLVALKTADQLDFEFTATLRAIADEPVRLERWVEAVTTLGSDPRIRDLSPRDLLDDEKKVASLKAITQTFSFMSSGHKIVLLTMTKLVENVSDRSLVLLDEPETHLHPPLLGSFIRALSRLLVARNGVAVIATHSPVVLQEVPKSCVWLLGSSSPNLLAERPPIETFAENVSVLTRKVFGLEVEDSGFYRILRQEATKAGASYGSVVNAFDEEIGAEGRALARAFTWKGD